MRPARGIRVEALGVGLGAAAILVIYACIAQYGIDLVDEGYFLDVGSRVQQGQITAPSSSGTPTRPTVP